jgi:hypothetical protein
MNKKEYIGAHKIPSDWPERVLILWEEDDATLNDPSAEKRGAAFARISGIEQATISRSSIASFEPEGSDFWMQLYRGGWVLGHTQSGGFVGCIVPKYKELP